ncbi:helix-turn-helix domain-containing protein [Streptomyces sp. 5.8]|uniref:helix-turn-helix domain-containing protein n=1 Tax=Streptomyces sp. 5.8 TaxID=3406571 RepID=UPI003BB5A611
MIGAELEKLLYTRPVPDTLEEQLAALLKWAKSSKQVVARELGVSRRTVQRWTAQRALARARWQPLMRARSMPR